MRTNFQMVVDFKDYMPARRGFTSHEEMLRIAEHFGLAEMTALELQNLRDMVVMVYSSWIEMSAETERQDLVYKQSQAMMSITRVIDSFKYKAGAEM